MNKREAAMRRLQSAKFALWEMHLYLDTHPEDLESIAAYKKYEAKYVLLLNEFEENYGAVTQFAPGVAWLKNPWPWESEVCD
ncbi:MAG: spore coat protein CotJB [Clostridia bacterium]|nr:spore coat protein CotJB [Clostridia bacterium]